MEKCFHCGLAAEPQFKAFINGDEKAFCCIGCQAVAQAIAGQGLSDFYRHRESFNSRPQNTSVHFEAYDLPSVQEDFVEFSSSGSIVVNLLVSGVSCAACVWLIEKKLYSLPGIIQVQVNASTHRARIHLRPDQTKVSDVFLALTSIGFEPQPMIGALEQELWQKDQKDYLLRMAVAGIGMMQAGMVAVALHAGDMQGIESHWQHVLRWVNLLMTLPIILYSAKPFFAGALRALRMKKLVNDVSISVALILAFSASVYATITKSGDVYFDSVGMFAFFLLLGRYLEKRARYTNFKASARFNRLLPISVNRVFSDSVIETIPFKQVARGDHLLVATGAVFPCDGIILDGHTEADESLLTGEATPKSKSPGDPVYAGTFNGTTQVKVSVSEIGQGTQLFAIEQLVQKAEQERPKQVTLADKIAARFVAFILSAATLVGIAWYFIDPSKAFWISLSVLVVSCPCALSLATPTVLTVAIGKMRQLGMLVTGGQVFEEMNAVNHVVFDKTGTLTDGALKIVDVRLITEARSSEQTQDAILQIAAALEEGSSHPIAQAFRQVTHSHRVVNRSNQTGLGVAGVIDHQMYRLGSAHFAFPQKAVEYPGEGLWLLLADEQHPLAWIRLEDQIRSSAVSCIEQLKQLGCNVSLLSGDRVENVEHAAQLLGIQDSHGGLLPADKLTYVRNLQKQGARVLMIGDGINDLPVLSGADVSCAMGSATRLAQTKADCVLLGEDLLQIPAALRFSRAVRSKIKQNLTWALIYNVCALPLAAAGFVPPWLAAIGMSASSLVVVMNSFRVGRTIHRQ